SRKNPLQPRHQNAPTTSATPAIRSNTPIATAAASEAITTQLKATTPRTTSATPRMTNQNQLPRRASSSWRSAATSGRRSRSMLIGGLLTGELNPGPRQHEGRRGLRPLHPDLPDG